MVIAGINGTDSDREFSFSTDFTDGTHKEMTLVTDGSGDRNLEYKKIACGDSLSVKFMPRGGFLALIK